MQENLDLNTILKLLRPRINAIAQARFPSQSAMKSLWTVGSASGAAIPLKKLGITGEIDDLVLRFTIRQTFRNSTDETIEAVYTFPTAWSSVLTEFAADIGGRRLVARPFKKSEGQAKYEAARDAGDAPMMIETNEQGIATATIGNLKPGESVTLSLAFITVLAPENGVVRFTLPLKIGRRYSPDGREGNLEPYERVTESLQAAYPATARFTVRGLLARAKASVPSHPAAFTQRGDALEIRVNRAFADRNLALCFEDVPDASAALFAPDPFDSGRWAGVIVTTPPRRTERAPLQVDLLLDCSGSMAGSGVVKMREAAASLADVLDERDFVTITRFGSATDVVQREPAPFGSAFRRRVFLPAVERIDADMGGTEITAALEATLRLPEAPGVRRIVLLVTDGATWDRAAMERMLQGASTPVFCLGVGESGVESLLRCVAEATGGLCEMVTHAEDMTSITHRLLSAARRPPAEPRLPLDTLPVLWHSPLPKTVRAGCGFTTFVQLYRRPDVLPAGALPAFHWVRFADDRALAKAVASRQCATSLESEAIARQHGLLTKKTVLLLVNERDASGKSVGDAVVNVPQMASFGLASRSSDSVYIPTFYRSNCFRLGRASQLPERKPSLEAAGASPSSAPAPRRENDVSDAIVACFCPSGAMRGEQRLTAFRRLASDVASLAQEMQELGLTTGDASLWSLMKRRMSFRDILSFRRARLFFFDVRIEFKFKLADDAVIDVIKALILLQAADRFGQELHLPPEAALVTRVASRRLAELIGADFDAAAALSQCEAKLKEALDASFNCELS